MKAKQLKTGVVTFIALFVCAIPAASSVYDQTNFTTIDVVTGTDVSIYDPVSFEVIHTGFPAIGAKYLTGSSPILRSFNLFGSNGDGTFTQLAQDIEMPEDAIVYNVTGDLNGDGYSDLYTCADASPVNYMRLSVAGGGLSNPYSFTPPAFTSIYSICNMDNDAYPDLNGVSQGCAVVWYGNGTEEYDVVSVSADLSALHSAAGDLDQDGDTDIVLIGSNNEIHILRNEGGRVFSDCGTYEPASGDGCGVFLCDLDNDSCLDLLVVLVTPADDEVMEFHTWMNDGTAGFTSGGVFQPGCWVNYCTVEDVDMDGCADLALVSGSYADASIDIYKGDGAGSFQLDPTLFSLPNVEIRTVTFEDYDCDGDPDMCCVTRNGNEFYLRAYWNTTDSQGCEGGTPVTDNLSINICSNPFSNGVNIELSNSFSPIALDILDLSGRVVNSISPQSEAMYHWDGTSFSGEQAPAGVYVISAGEPGVHTTARLVKLD